jgi:AcrR family transcriptional regulator
MSVIRARDDQAKHSRRHQLLAAAAARLDAAGYAATTMAEIAAAAGLAKGTTYLYFRSKEALFLGLLLEDLEEWSGRVVAELAGAGEGEPRDRPSRALAASLGRRPRLVRLLALCHPVLLGGAGADAVDAFRGRRRALLESAAAGLDAAPDGLGGEGLGTLSDLFALAVGLAELGDARAPERGFEMELAAGLDALRRGRRASPPPAP